MQQSYSAQEQAQRLAERVTSQIESVPADSFLLGAAFSVGASLILRLTGRFQDALFVGQWAPTLLLVGLYSKVMSSDALRQKPAEPSHEATGDAMH
jgi:hypothetical protein